jgi:hypothetical protein
MYRKLLIAFAIVLVLTYGLVAWAAYQSRKWVKMVVAEMEAEGKPWQEVGRQTKSFTVPTGRRVILENERGDVTVLPGGGEIRVEAVSYVSAETAAEARQKAKPASISGAQLGGDAFRIMVSTSRHGLRAKTDLTVRVPKGAALEVRHDLGDVSVSGMEAAVSAKSSAGNVRVEECRGPVTITNTAGNTEVRSVRGDATVSSSAGEISLHDIRGCARARGTAGNISMDEIRGDTIEAATSAGNVEIHLPGRFAGRLKAESSAGNVSVVVPRDARCRVRAHTSLGSVHNSLPAEVTAGDPPGLIEVSVSMGNVQIGLAE